MTIWLVRAGRHGERQNYALDNNIVMIGWDETPDLSQYPDKGALREMYAANARSDRSTSFISNHVSQLWAFAKRIQVGDIVALPLKGQDAIAFGRVTGDYQHRPDNPPGAKHIRPVEWITQDLPRSALDQDLLNSLGAFLTVCQIKRNDAEARIRAVLEGKAPPPLVPAPTITDDTEPTDETTEFNLTDYAADQIRTYLSRNFANHDFPRIVEAILHAQGYQTETSDPGPDGGVDIIAGRGPLGFDPPRLVVQVKATGTREDIKVLRELKGVMKDFNADQGLFVSWSGFKRSVMSEARRHFFEIRLWDAGDVIEAIQEHYDDFPDALKAELPLKRIWMLALDDVQ